MKIFKFFSKAYAWIDEQVKLEKQDWQERQSKKQRTKLLDKQIETASVESLKDILDAEQEQISLSKKLKKIFTWQNPSKSLNLLNRVNINNNYNLLKVPASDSSVSTLSFAKLEFQEDNFSLLSVAEWGENSKNIDQAQEAMLFSYEQENNKKVGEQLLESFH